MTLDALPGFRLPTSVGQRVGLAGALWVAAGLVLVAGAFGWQAAETGGAPRLDLPLLLPALALASGSFGLRALRWHLFLGAAGARLPFWTSLRTQLVGFSLTMTPGKIGELYKCYLVEQRTGVPAARTAPIVLFEKLMDGVAFIGLALVAGATLFGPAQAVSSDVRSVAVVAAAVAVLALLVRAIRPEAVERTLLRRLAWVPKGPRAVALVGTALRGGADLLKPPLLARNLAISIVARSCDGLAMTCVVWALGLDLPLLSGVFVLNSSGALGGLSMLPGGIGVVEAGMSVLLVSLGATPGVALIGTLIARILSFWLWVAIGLSLLLRSSLAVRPKHSTILSADGNGGC